MVPPARPGPAGAAGPGPGRRQAGWVRFSDEQHAHGRRASSVVVDAGLRDAVRSERQWLHLEPGQQVVAITRVRLSDAVPVMIQTSVLPDELAAVLESDLVDGTLYRAMESLGRVATSGRSTLSARNATVQDAALLAVHAGIALLVERRLTFDQHGDPLVLSEARSLGDRHVIEVAFESLPDPVPAPPARS